MAKKKSLVRRDQRKIHELRAQLCPPCRVRKYGCRAHYQTDRKLSPYLLPVDPFRSDNPLPAVGKQHARHHNARHGSVQLLEAHHVLRLHQRQAKTAARTTRRDVPKYREVSKHQKKYASVPHTGCTINQARGMSAVCLVSLPSGLQKTRPIPPNSSHRAAPSRPCHLYSVVQLFEQPRTVFVHRGN